MLILTRRVGEVLNIGDDVTVTVLGVKGNQVRIGVGAPKSVAVHRSEIFDKIQAEQAEADKDKKGLAKIFQKKVPMLSLADRKKEVNES